MKSWRLFVVTVSGAATLILGLMLAVSWFIAPRDSLRKADAIVVVSGGDTNQRTDEGVRLWRAGWAPKLIFSGAAADQGTSNAAAMRLRALASGVPIDSTIIEERSTNTRENAQLLKPVLQAQDVRTIIVVSSPYHTRRVKVNFQKALGKDYDLLVHPAVDTAWSRSSWWQQQPTIQLTWDELRKTFYARFLQN